jgi:hypothetical protein
MGFTQAPDRKGEIKISVTKLLQIEVAYCHIMVHNYYNDNKGDKMQDYKMTEDMKHEMLDWFRWELEQKKHLRTDVKHEIWNDIQLAFWMIENPEQHKANEARELARNLELEQMKKTGEV